MKLGRSVQWYTALNPIPNLPILAFDSAVFFKESPILCIDLKSAIMKGKTSKDPWQEQVKLF
jgi:hypothetical protein